MMIASGDPIQTLAPGRLRCVLRQRASTGRVFQAEFDLENCSSSTIEIPVDVHPLQYLNLRVKNGAGETVSEGWYGNQFSPAAAASTIRLLPGERLTLPVSLLATVPVAVRVPGEYTIEGLYDTGDFQLASEPLTLIIS